MSAPYACKECARPMYFPKEEQLCASCEEEREKKLKKKYGQLR
jgi:exosome complex RNA-binding protein Csl4